MANIPPPIIPSPGNAHFEIKKSHSPNGRTPDVPLSSNKAREGPREGPPEDGLSEKDDVIRGLLFQLKANTERLEALEKQFEAAKEKNGAVIIIDESKKEDGIEEDGASDKDDSDSELAETNGDNADEAANGSQSQEQRTTSPIVAAGMKYVTSEDWLRNHLDRTYRIGGHFPNGLSLVVSKKSASSTTIQRKQGTPDVANAKSANSTMGQTKKAAADTKNDAVIDKIAPGPDRLAITCAALLAEVARISGTPIPERTNVLLRPFKNIVPFREEFAQSLQKNKEAYKELCEARDKRKAEYEAACKKAAEENDDDNKDTPAPPKNEKYLDSEARTSLRTAKKLYYGLTCLLHFIDHDLADVMELRRQTKGPDFEIEFEHLWHLFEPGMIICEKGDELNASRVLNVSGGRPRYEKLDHDGQPVAESRDRKVDDFVVDCFWVDFDGVFYGPAPTTFNIAPYEGKRALKNLAIAPLASMYAGKEEERIKKQLIDRGMKFERLAAVSHQRYSGLSVKAPGKSFRIEEIDGDVIIDFALAFKNTKSDDDSKPEGGIDPPIIYGAIDEYLTVEPIEERLEIRVGCFCPECEENRVFDDFTFEMTRRSAFLKQYPSLAKLESKNNGDDIRYMLLPCRMYGYVLLSRKWYPLDIDLLEDIRENQQESDGFDDLVLPEDHKQIVRALVKTHARGPRSPSDKNGRRNRQMDLVKGKGKGLIILLHGVPGVGKTSTAECVAAHTNRPLFPITCGDIGGQTPREVEANLESYFDLARKWGCVLLLDEADVFLGERTKGDILQNSLVSVFLRVLEYYSGILILTTNRVGQFDEAIKSRIHISLYYPPLNKDRTLQIWEMNLKRLERLYGVSSTRNDEGKSPRKPTLPHVEFDSDKIMAFAKGHWKTCKPTKSSWNGRQIKNAFQTAVALAEWDALNIQREHKLKEPVRIILKTEHFQKVAEASARFDQYLVSVRDHDTKNAINKKDRQDEFKDTGESTKYGIRYATYGEIKEQRRSARRQQVQVIEEEEDDSSDSSDAESSLSETTKRALEKAKRKKKKAKEGQKASAGRSRKAVEEKRFKAVAVSEVESEDDSSS